MVKKSNRKKSPPAASKPTKVKRDSQTSQPSKVKKSPFRPLAVVAVGLAAAVTLAVIMTSGGEAEPTITPIDPALFVDAADLGHVEGADNPAVTLIEFGDYSCPTCGLFYPMLEELVRRMPTELALEFHHYPIPVGPHSFTAAVAAEAAGLQGRFWEMHGALYRTQSQWSSRPEIRETFVSMAGQLGLDTDRFTEDLDSETLQARVAADRQQGDRIGVAGTPSFFINGQRLDYLPQSVDEFETIIRSVLGQ